MSPCPNSRSTAAIASSSASSDERVGAGVPSPKKCVGDSDVDQPTAPARIAPRTTSCMRAISSAVAARSTAALPITRKRTADMPTNAATLGPIPCRSSAVR